VRYVLLMVVRSSPCSNGFPVIAAEKFIDERLDYSWLTGMSHELRGLIRVRARPGKIPSLPSGRADPGSRKASSHRPFPMHSAKQCRDALNRQNRVQN